MYKGGRGDSSRPHLDRATPLHLEMNFVSFGFLLLLSVVLLIRTTLGTQKIEKPYLISLLGASMVFYAWHIPIYALIILTSSMIDYIAGLYLGKKNLSPARRKWVQFRTRRNFQRTTPDVRMPVRELCMNSDEV